MRTTIVGTVLALATLFAAAPAMAGERHGGKANFPVPAAEFKARIDARQAKARERMEARASKLGAEEAKALRAKFAAGAARIDAEVGKAVADGTVTKEEAKAVRQAVREVRGHGPGHHGKGGCDHDKKS